MSTNSSRFATYREISGNGARVFLENADNTEGFFPQALENVRTRDGEQSAIVVLSARMGKIAMIIEELYDALIEAGVSDEKARAAARVIANFDIRLFDIKSDVTLLKWMVGFNLALTVAVLFRVFS